MDSDLTFAEHISKKVKVVNGIVGLIRRSFSFLDCKSFKKIFTAFVSRTCIISLGPSSMQIHQHAERLERLQLPSITYRRVRGDMIELFKHFHTCDKRILSPTFQPRERSTRRHEFQLLDRKPKDGIRGIQSNSFYRSTKTWNGLPSHIVNAKHINSFKTLIDEYWKDKMYDLRPQDNNNH